MIIIFFGNTKYSTIGAKVVNTVYPISQSDTRSEAIISLFVTIQDSPVSHLADELHIPVLETEKLDSDIIEKIAKLKSDFIIVEDYGLILPSELLKLPKYAPLNIHHSLLPKYRGPSPAPSAILAGEKVSGVTIIKMTEEVDAGDILAQQEYELKVDETTDSLLTELNELGGEMVIEVIKQYLEGSTKAIPQDHSKATYTKRFRRKDGYFDIENPPSKEKLDRMIRAYYPWPGVWTRWNNKIVKFLPLSSHPEPFASLEGKLREGSLTNVSSNELRDSSLIAQNDKFLLQMEGKKAISLKDFLNGYPDFPLKNIL